MPSRLNIVTQCNCKELRSGRYIGRTYLCKHNNLLALNPKICEGWNYDKNDLGPENYTSSSNKRVWWKCVSNPCGCHVWEATINNRVKAGSCPFCSKTNKRICPHNNLLALNPELCKEWDYDKNQKRAR